MINIPPILGNLNPVPLSSYKEIIGNYVDKVGNLEQVSSIIQMGSFTAPGISDIDLIVVIKEGMPFPGWNEISLKNISKNHKDAEVIAHDIFVIPESVAKNAEAYFYIDQQIILKGERLGGYLSKDIAEKCKEFLAVEYAVFSLESIANLLLSTAVELRSIVLLISTMRHSARIAFDLRLINTEDKNTIIKSVEELRNKAISKEYFLHDFSHLFERFINLLNDTILAVSKSLNRDIDEESLRKKWITSAKTGMVGIQQEVNFTEAFLNIIDKQKNSFPSKHTKIFAVPIKSQMHIGAYLDGNDEPALYFKNSFKDFPVFHDKDELNTKARKVRGHAVKQHWDFITRTGYLQSSGKAYFGLSYPGNKNFNSFLKKKMLLYQLSKF